MDTRKHKNSQPSRKSIEITNIEHARSVANEFNNKMAEKYKNLDFENIEKLENISTNNESYTASLTDQHIAQLNSDEQIKLTRAITKLQRSLREKQAKDTFLKFNPNGLHSHEASVFANKQVIDLNINMAKQQALLLAYRNQDWQAEIFSDPLVLKIAFALFANGKIQQVEFESLLIIHYAKSPIVHENFVPETEKYTLSAFKILDEQGNFTEDAYKYLIPALPGHMGQPFNAAQLKNLQLLIQVFLEKYPSENVFFTHEAMEYALDEFGVQMANTSLRQTTLYVGDKPNKNDIRAARAALNGDENEKSSLKKFTKITLPCMMEDALSLSCFSVEDTVPIRSVAGDLSISDIERFTNVGIRPGALVFPDTVSNANIHNFTSISDASKREHDRYHSQLMTREGIQIRNILKRMKDISRNEILINCSNLQNKSYPQLFSVPTWLLVDAELPYFNMREFDVAETVTTSFCNAFEFASKRPTVLYDDQQIITDLGILTYIDMYNNPEIWYEMGFDTDLLTGQFKTHYDCVTLLAPYFKSHDSKYNIILFRMYLILGPSFFNTIDYFPQQYEASKDKFEFRRNNHIKFIGLIDKETGEKLHDTLLLNFLIAGNNEILPHQDFNIIEHNSLLQAIYLLAISFPADKYKSIHSKVYVPLLQIYLHVLTTNDVGSLKNIDKPISELASIFNRYAKSNSSRIDKNQLGLIQSLHQHLTIINNKYTQLRNKPIVKV